MSDKTKRLFELLKYSQKLEQENKELIHIDRNKFNELTHLLAIIELNLHLREKKNYIELTELFLKNVVDADDFSYLFIAKHYSINQHLRDMEDNFESNFDELSILLTENENCDNKLKFLFMSMYDNCSDFDPNLDESESIIDEETFKNSAEKFLRQLKQL